jgi:cell division protease FtsH
MKLAMTPETLDYAVRRTADFVEGSAAGTRYSGDHLNALCRAIARARLRDNRGAGGSPASAEEPASRLHHGAVTEPEDIDRALTEWLERPQMTPAEERVVATHESGHAVCSLFCPHATPIERISIQADTAWALGYVRRQDPAHKYVVTQGELLDDLCILMGGREAELMLLDDLSIGSSGDLQRATAIARSLVEQFGMGGAEVGVGRFQSDNGEATRVQHLSPTMLEALDRRIREILEESRVRACTILRENRALVETLRDMLLEKKVIDAKALGSIVSNMRK